MMGPLSGTLAPVALFVYARPSHTRRTLAALLANAGVEKTPLIVFSDGPRTPQDQQAVADVRDIIRATKGFESVTLVERPRNMGLADNIVQGLDNVFQQHERAIVLEDDIECAPDFLCFMNEALDRYERDARIWHVNGWNYPISAEGLPGTYCSSTMTCWGWASWRDRWCRYNPDAAYFMKRWGWRKRLQFNQRGSYPFYSHLIGNHIGWRKTWAIYWYATIFDAGGLCIQPASTLTQEIGSDGSGTHGLNNDMYMADRMDVVPRHLDQLSVIENELARQRVEAFNRRHFGWRSRVPNTVKLLMPTLLYTIVQYWRRHGNHA
jgi:hypothetical protein